MRVMIDGAEQSILAVDMNDGIVEMIDQRVLPFHFTILRFQRWQDTVEGIRDLVTRGAGSVGVAGAFAVAQAAQSINAKTLNAFIQELQHAAKVVVAARPTAITLKAAVDYCLQATKRGATISDVREGVVRKAREWLIQDMKASEAIGKVGQSVVGNDFRFLTHCNTGPLAMQDDGTALAVIRFAHQAQKVTNVFVSETRPWLQGSRLTTWELQLENIPHQLIIDSVSGYLFQQNLVDVVIVGADRIVANGDTANKIGTYEKAILAYEHDIPFYVAAPTNAFDLKCPNGEKVTIEERPAQEVLSVKGFLSDGSKETIQVSPEGTNVLNPVFDITPVKYITGFITEKGILTDVTPTSIGKLIAKV